MGGRWLMQEGEKCRWPVFGELLGSWVNPGMGRG